MMVKDDRYTRIREFLQERYPATVSISTISREPGVNRHSVAKHLEVLQSHDGEEIVDRSSSLLSHRHWPQTPSLQPVRAPTSLSTSGPLPKNSPVDPWPGTHAGTGPARKYAEQTPLLK